MRSLASFPLLGAGSASAAESLSRTIDKDSIAHEGGCCNEMKENERKCRKTVTVHSAHSSPFVCHAQKA